MIQPQASVVDHLNHKTKTKNKKWVTRQIYRKVVIGLTMVFCVRLSIMDKRYGIKFGYIGKILVRVITHCKNSSSHLDNKCVRAWNEKPLVENHYL